MPIEEAAQQELERLEDQSPAAAIVSLGIMLVAKRLPVTHGVVVGGVYTAFLIVELMVIMVIVARFERKGFYAARSPPARTPP